MSKRVEEYNFSIKVVTGNHLDNEDLLLFAKEFVAKIKKCDDKLYERIEGNKNMHG